MSCSLSITPHASLKSHLLLTSAITALYGYCHNEGQAKSTVQLSPEAINHFLANLATGNRPVSKIILSGSEPNLLPQLAEIRRRCKARGALTPPGLHTVVDHLLQSFSAASEFIATICQLGVVCNLIELLDIVRACPKLPGIPWDELGYPRIAPGSGSPASVVIA